MGQHNIKADEYLKKLIFTLSLLYKQEHGDCQDVTVPLFTTLHSTSESILILLLNNSILDADVLLRTVMEVLKFIVEQEYNWYYKFFKSTL